MTSSPTEPLRILFEDHHLIAVDKPAGLVVHPGTGHTDSLVQRVRDALVTLHGPGRYDRVAPVHRLDRDTSGVVVFGKTEAGLRKMARLFETGEIEKQYLVLAKGVTHKKGKINVPLLARPRPDRRKEGPEESPADWFDPDADDAVVWGEPDEAEVRGKFDAKREEALTTYRRLIEVKGLSLLVVRPHTGRQHQIRRHLKSIAHPVAGDVRWGDARFNYWLKQHGLNRPFIHAALLAFPHPLTGEPVTLRATLPDELVAVLASLGFVPLRPPWGPAPAQPSEGQG